MLNATTAALFFATPMCKNAEIVSIRTVRAGEAGKFDVAMHKVVGQRNRYFLTVDGQLKPNRCVEMMLSETPQYAEQYFANEYTNTLLAIQTEAKEIIARGEKLGRIAQDLAANTGKAAIQAKTGVKAPNAVRLLAYFAEYWGIVAQ